MTAQNKTANCLFFFLNQFFFCALENGQQCKQNHYTVYIVMLVKRVFWWSSLEFTAHNKTYCTSNTCFLFDCVNWSNILYTKLWSWNNNTRCHEETLHYVFSVSLRHWRSVTITLCRWSWLATLLLPEPWLQQPFHRPPGWTWIMITQWGGNSRQPRSRELQDRNKLIC